MPLSAPCPAQTMCPPADDVGKRLPTPNGAEQLSEIQDYEETAAALCLRADAEQDFDRLLELAAKIQQLIEARWSRNTPRPSECHTLGSRMPLTRAK